MMSSKIEPRKKIGENSGNGKLLNEIEAISKALYVDNRSLSRSSSSTSISRSKPAWKSSLAEPKLKIKSVNEDSSQKDKRSFWNWKPLKAFSNVRNRRFNCCFSLQINNIEGLPRSFGNSSVCVHWKRRDGDLVTRPVNVVNGVAEFEEKLTYTCSVYGSRSGPHHSAKYEAKHFLLYASMLQAPELDLGKHRVDLTRLLPITLEELDEEKSSGTWTTSFKLSGKARGATMNVSFGYMIVEDNPVPSQDYQNVAKVSPIKQNNQSFEKPVTRVVGGDGKRSLKRFESLPNRAVGQSRAAFHSIDDVKDLHEVLPLSRSVIPGSVRMLARKFDIDKLDASVGLKPEPDVYTEEVEPVKPQSHPMPDANFTVAERGIELSSEEVAESDSATIVNSDTTTLESPPVVKVEFAAGAASEENDQLPGTDEGGNLESPRVVKVEFDAGAASEENDQLPRTDEDGNLESPRLVKVEYAAGVDFEENDQLPGTDEGGNHESVLLQEACISREDNQCSKESLLEDLELAFNSVSNLETGIDSPDGQGEVTEFQTDHQIDSTGVSNSLDGIDESVESEFLNMLGIEDSPLGLNSGSEPESPRERLLRQFEKEAEANGYSLFDFDMDDNEQPESSYGDTTEPDWGNFSEGFDLSAIIEAAEEEHRTPILAGSKTKAKILEDLETEALMSEWGLNEKAFQGSPDQNSGGFGSPFDLPPEDPLELPPLGEGLGPFIQTKDGGFLRSMNPTVFKNAKSGGSLIMQVSNPVVVPAEMGSGVMEILQHLASLGIEKLSGQANKLMPLEDITGKSMLQVAWEAAPALEGPQREFSLDNESELLQHLTSGKKEVRGKRSGSWSDKVNSTPPAKEISSEYVSLEDLAPLAMDKIEALSMEGLRIQSGMSDEDAPSNINARSFGEISALQGKDVSVSGSLGLEGAAGMQLLDVKDSGDEGDELMGLSLTLDEWMKLDSGEIDDGDQISERTSKILAAHHASSLHSVRGGSKRGKKCGLLGNNFTVALMVQLRDPLRNYEPVGAPMLSLIQVERVFVPPKPRIYCTVSEFRTDYEKDDSPKKTDAEIGMEEEKPIVEEEVAQFKITEVHLAGLKPEPTKSKLWGSKNQQQSGSRWLLATGMGKNNKHPIMKSSKPAPKSSAPAAPAAPASKSQSGDSLWSVSSRDKGFGAKWKQVAALNPHIRNPNVILPK